MRAYGASETDAGEFLETRVIAFYLLSLFCIFYIFRGGISIFGGGRRRDGGFFGSLVGPFILLPSFSWHISLRDLERISYPAVSSALVTLLLKEQ